MGERVGDDVALTAPLKAIVADGRRGLHRGLYVTGFDETPLLLGVMGPHARQAIGLQLDPDLELIGLGLIHAALDLLHTGQDAEQVLHVVADLVGDYIGLGELAALTSDITAVKAQFEVPEERGIEIDLLIVGALEGAHRGLRVAACRNGGTRK